jgi:hypothetical protein
MGGKSAPKAPDYQAAAAQQAQSSREVTEQQTWANRPDQFTPYGSSTWENQQTWDPATEQYINRWAQNLQLDPDAQRALDAQQRLGAGRSELGETMMDRSQQEFGNAMDWSKMHGAGGDVQAGNLDSSGKYAQNAEDALYGRWASRALPEQDRQTDATRTRLYNMGLKEGDPAYDREMQKLSQNQGDALQQAAFGATAGAGAEAQRYLGMDAQAGAQNFGQQMQASQYSTQQRQQQIAEEMQRRGFSLNEMNALINGQQVAMPNMPQFNTAQRAEGTQNLQAAQMTGQSALDAFNAEQQAMQGMMSGVGSMAGGFAGFKG